MSLHFLYCNEKTDKSWQDNSCLFLFSQSIKNKAPTTQCDFSKIPIIGPNFSPSKALSSLPLGWSVPLYEEEQGQIQHSSVLRHWASGLGLQRFHVLTSDVSYPLFWILALQLYDSATFMWLKTYRSFKFGWLTCLLAYRLLFSS